MKITILTLGTHGDVQPYVALGLGLRRAGHHVTVAAGERFAPFITGYGLDYAHSEWDFPDLLQSRSGRAALGQGERTVHSLRGIAPVLRRVLDQEWAAAHDAEAIIYHPKAFGGYHIAEKLGVPGFLAVPFPAFSPTSAFPNLFLSVSENLGSFLNLASYGAFIRLNTTPYWRVINRWRREVLGLPPRSPVTDYLRQGGLPVTRLYCYSPHVIPTPDDWNAASVATGYWFLDRRDDWHPPADLVRFLAVGPPPVYVGFGSMIGRDPAATTAIVLDALRLSGERAVLARGWGGLDARDVSGEVCVVDSIPHDWLFPQVAAVVHHGGAGTTAAALRAGVPSVICPFFGDQPFWGRRIHALGVGPEPIPHNELTAARLGDAIRCATSDSAMRAAAADLGATIRAENGVARAVNIINERLWAGRDLSSQQMRRGRVT